MRKILLLLAAFALSSAAAPAAAPGDHTIVVSGYGEVSVVPDKVTVDIGVVTSDKFVTRALEANNEQMQRVVGALRKVGVAEAEMQTSGFTIEPLHPKLKDAPYLDDETVTLGYQVANKITVSVNDIAKTALIIDAAVKAGANSSNSVDFDLKDRAAYEDKAMTAAMRDARHNAETLAAAENAKVGKAVSITNGPSYAYDIGAFPSSPLRMAAPMLAPIMPGLIKIRANVVVTYTLE